MSRYDPNTFTRSRVEMPLLKLRDLSLLLSPATLTTKQRPDVPTCRTAAQTRQFPGIDLKTRDIKAISENGLNQRKTLFLALSRDVDLTKPANANAGSRRSSLSLKPILPLIMNSKEAPKKSQPGESTLSLSASPRLRLL